MTEPARFDPTQSDDANKARKAFLDALAAFETTCNQKHEDKPTSQVVEHLLDVHRLFAKISGSVEAAGEPSWGWATCLEACSAALHDLLPPAAKKQERFTELVALFSPESITMQKILAQDLALQSHDAAKQDPAAALFHESLAALLEAYKALPAQDRLEAQKYGQSCMWYHSGWRITRFGTGEWMNEDKEWNRSGYDEMPPWDGNAEIICNIKSSPTLLTAANGYAHIVCSRDENNLSGGHANIQVRADDGETVASICIKKPYEHAIGRNDDLTEPLGEYKRAGKDNIAQLSELLKGLEAKRPAANLTFPAMGVGMQVA